MPKNFSKDYSKEPRLKPRPMVGTAAIMMEAQGISPWVGGPTTPYGFTTPSYMTPPKEPGAANRIPPEIAAKIAKYLDVKDLGRATLAWRSVALASYASPEYIKLECGKYSLLTNPSLAARGPDAIRTVRERIQQYNFAWSSMLFSDCKFFTIPQTTQDTPWAGSDQWKSGNRFVGESNGYMYDVSSWDTGTQMQARVCLHRLPSLRTGELGLKRHQFDVALMSHFVKAVTVDPVGKVVAILEFNTDHTHDPYTRIPFMHVFKFSGQHIGTVQLRAGFPTLAEVYHMELHGEMVCIIANYDSPESILGTASNVVVQSWVGAPRSFHIQRCYGGYCTGFQFITEDLWILTEKGKTDPRDTIPTSVIRVGHVRLNAQTMVNLADIHGKGWTPNTISLIRNVSQYSPVSGPFSPDPASRLFGIKYEYRQYDGNVSANSCLFGRTTVESWLGIPASGPIEPVHWILMPILNDADPRRNGGRPPKYDPTNREGLALIGRRLFWAEIWPNGWSLNLLDYNPGAGNAVCEKKEPRGQMWQSYTCYFCSDPYPVAYTVSDRITDLDRIVPTEDGLLLKHNLHGTPSYTMLMM
ncbi:hypothetical protein B0H13DRAFT_2011590 [Mycena leptocephala]|nr:hypothetical protein B0H13DRAFT_2011590 [Mycena leptocephala]